MVLEHMVLEHLGAGLGGEHVDGPAPQAVGSVVELEASADIGLDLNGVWSSGRSLMPVMGKAWDVGGGGVMAGWLDGGLMMGSGPSPPPPG